MWAHMTQKNEEQDAIHKTLEQQLKQDFLDDCSDKLEAMSNGFEDLANGPENQEDIIVRIRRDAHSLKGMGSSFGFPAVTVVAHRMEDFMSGRTTINNLDIQQAYKFIDKIKDLMSLDRQPDSNEIAEIARSLPSQFSVQQTATAKSKHVLSIMPKSVQQRLINEDLQACGFNVSCLHSSFEAIEIAVHTRPDLIVISAVIDEIEGLELAHIFHTVQSTKNTPIIVVTTYDERKLPGKDLPMNVSVARKGSNFAEDLSACLLELGLFTG